MSLSSSLFSGISGLSTLGNAMTVIGDNIANVNTMAFKSSRVVFEDVLSQSVATSSGSAQVGRGTALADISTSFDQASFESTSSPTDLAIGGDGFFAVRDPGSAENLYYTRAGKFSFDKDGYFTNPAGYIVRGWELTETGEDKGSVTDIKLTSFTSPPKATSKVSVITNLDSEGEDNSDGAASGVEDTALSANWDGTDEADARMDEENYEYQTTVKVYDSLGSTHDITMYFDKIVPADDSDVTADYEFVVVGNPEEDGRTNTDGDTADLTAADTGAGMLARGSIEFDVDGEIKDINMERFEPDANWDVTDANNWVTLDGLNDAGDALETGEVKDGLFLLKPTFTTGDAMEVKLDLGAKDTDPAVVDPLDPAGDAWVPATLSSTMYKSASTTVFQSADGYGAGDLSSVSVATDGVITGQYSNGQVIPLYRVGLAKFQNNQGLFKVGGNLFRETRISGAPTTAKPGTNGLGNISPNSLEQSNVDLAREFVTMITTQRGFQANSKVITVTDQMLAELINLKR